MPTDIDSKVKDFIISPTSSVFKKEKKKRLIFGPKSLSWYAQGPLKETTYLLLSRNEHLNDLVDINMKKLLLKYWIFIWIKTDTAFW